MVANEFSVKVKTKNTFKYDYFPSSTAQKFNFSSFLQISLHLVKKSLMENFIFWAVFPIMSEKCIIYRLLKHQKRLKTIIKGG